MYFGEDTVLFMDGNFLKASEAAVSPYSQTLHYGLGVYEGIRAYQTLNGTRIFKPEEHFSRLLKTSNQLGLSLDYSAEELTQISYSLIEKNDLTCAYLRPLVVGGPQMKLASPSSASIIIAVWKWGRYFEDNSLKLCFSTVQRQNPEACIMGGKITGHYVNAILAARQATERGYDESLMIDQEGYVAQAPGANFFFEKDGALYTAPQRSIFPGITRETVMEICRQLDIRVIEKKFLPEEILEFDAAFLCGTATEISPVEIIEGHAAQINWRDSASYAVQEGFKSLVLDLSFTNVIV
ncbi:MAG: aminotransferase class IV [Bacteroidetes bacterium]|nr:aminotransferase class IV [Bacteroidota bacterium]